MKVEAVSTDPKEEELFHADVTIPLTLTAVSSMDAIRCGLRQSWLDCKDPKCSLQCGAGLGSPWLYIDLDGNSYRADMRSFLASFVETVEGESED